VRGIVVDAVAARLVTPDRAIVGGVAKTRDIVVDSS
jgi:hypothetical protein